MPFSLLPPFGFCPESAREPTDGRRIGREKFQTKTDILWKRNGTRTNAELRELKQKNKSESYAGLKTTWKPPILQSRAFRSIKNFRNSICTGNRIKSVKVCIPNRPTAFHAVVFQSKTGFEQEGDGMTAVRADASSEPRRLSAFIGTRAIVCVCVRRAASPARLQDYAKTASTVPTENPADTLPTVGHTHY